MNEESFNLELRKFLKKVGITSQREIEQGVRAAIAAGTLNGHESLEVKMHLELPALGIDQLIAGHIDLE